MKRFKETRPLILAYLKLRQEKGQEPPYLREMAQDLALSINTLLNERFQR
ncbi:hypothetical protein [Streptomyces sp. SPB074]|nr:hypothetical protein [Streptomyces sp. SPB074]